MFERFTDRARASVVLAQDQARRLHHDYIGTEHLLLGLLAETDGVAAKVLDAMGVRIAAVEADVVAIIGRGEAEPSGHIPFTPRAKKVLELSLREALQLGHAHIGTEHILLGLIREGEGVAAEVLVKYEGITLDAARERVLAHLSGIGPERPGSKPRARTPAATEILQAAEQLAGDAPVGSHHLLQALLEAEGSMAANALAALGIDPRAVGATLGELRVEDTTDVTPEEAAARQMELRVDGDEVHIVIGDPATVERGTMVVGLAGGAVKGEGPNAAVFIPIWSVVRNSLARLEAALTAEHPAPAAAQSRRRRRRKPTP
jgi:ATP-dependent Clp protease ATP-binding subunit ClpA